MAVGAQKMWADAAISSLCLSLKGHWDPKQDHLLLSALVLSGKKNKEQNMFPEVLRGSETI